MTDISPEDIAELRKDPDSFRDYLRHITGRAVESPATANAEPAVEVPSYHIPRKGAWPCGTAATGPTPPACDHPAGRPAEPHAAHPADSNRTDRAA